MYGIIYYNDDFGKFRSIPVTNGFKNGYMSGKRKDGVSVKPSGI